MPSDRPAEIDGLRRFLRGWPPWVRLFPATWFEQVVRGEMRPWFALATDADVGVWAYSRASPGAYSHEMSPGYELESALKTFAASEAMGLVRRVRTCHEGGGVLLRHATHLYGIQLVDEARADTLQTLLDAPWTPTLRELSLENRDRGVPSGAWPRLAARLRSVHVLRLRWVDIDGAFIRALLGEAGAQPEVLVLFPARGDGAVEARIGADGLRAIARSDQLSALQVINIMHTPESKLVRAELHRRFKRVIDVSV